VRTLFLAALTIFSSCAVESHAVARRDEVRKYQAEHPASARVPDNGQLGPWSWGMTPDEVLAVTPNAWSEGDGLVAPVALGAVHGLATLYFQQGALSGIQVIAPNQPGVEQQLRGSYLRSLGEGYETCPACDLKQRAAADGVAGAVGATLFTVLGVASIATGHPGTLYPPLYDPYFPWMVAANVDDPVRTVDWTTPATQAHLGIDGASLVFSARARPGFVASAQP
jgi:hypothetical protein